jgi:protein involved in polysaccharide export with SLBB domain
LDFRLLATPPTPVHTVDTGDTLGIYIADILGERESLPSVDYPNFRLKNAPITPFVGQPISVEPDGTIHLPMVGAVLVRGLNLAQVRDLLIHKYSIEKQLIRPGRDSVTVSLISARAAKVYVVRQDTRYNLPGLQQANQFETSRRWAGTTLYLEPGESHVLNALMKTGGLPGIDARNEIWVMKGVPSDQSDQMLTDLDRFTQLPGDNLPPEAIYHVEEELTHEPPFMLTLQHSNFIRIPLEVPLGQELPFKPDDVNLQDGDIVFLPRRDGDVYLTGGLLPPGRYPLNRDRDLDVVEAIAAATGNNLGPVYAPRSTGQFRSGPGNIIPATDVIIVRRLNYKHQMKIYVDLRKAMDDPSERVLIAPGDLLILNYKPWEIISNVMLNFVNFSYGLETL